MKKLAFLFCLVASTVFAAGSVSIDDFPSGIRTPTMIVTQSLMVNGSSVAALTLGTANGLSLVGSTLSLGLADGTHAGALDFNAQTIGGAKTFTGAISASNLSGTNSGDITLGTANGLSLVGQALSLGLADATHTGAVSSTTQTLGGAKTLTALLTITGPTTNQDALVIPAGARIELNSGTTWIQDDGSGNIRLNSSNTIVTGFLTVGGSYVISQNNGYRSIPNTLISCDATKEGLMSADGASGGTNTTHRSRLCYCTSDGAASPTYAWRNMTSGTVGTTTTCSD